MPLQNRVTPFSTIERSPARGLFTGNRGILHNHLQQLLTTRWRHKSWIVCELEFKGWHRKLMQPGHWTELFFLDEASAFAAGHRPCALCRRSAYKQFLNSSEFPSAKQLDNTLHAERTQTQPLQPIGQLPNCTIFAIGNQAYLKHNANSLPWSHNGYQATQQIPQNTRVQPLTPQLTQLVLAAGYQPVLHPSAVII